jgi:hypothetical protein
MRRYFLGFAMLFLASPTWGAGKAAGLYTACTSTAGTKEDAICTAYINGFANGVLGDQVAKEGGNPICVPDNTSTDQIRALFTAFVRTHPKALEFDTGGVLAELMAEAYPCRKSN